MCFYRLDASREKANFQKDLLLKSIPEIEDSLFYILYYRS